MVESKTQRFAFTRADLLVVIGCISLLGFIWVPSLANSTARNDEAVCANNLRMIGRAFQEWWQENDERLAWYRPIGDPTATKSYPWHANVWFQFFWLSNQLHSPRYLADPADDWPSLKVATSWGAEKGGLVQLGFQNNAISYFLGLHGTPLQPNSILGGDGNVGGRGPTGCSSGINNATDVRPEYAVWPETRHGARGNLLFSDGRVEMTDTVELKEAVAWRGEGYSVHILKPRP